MANSSFFKAVKSIKKWRSKQKLDSNQFGFFAVNMASTGKGKTFANAKIMRSLSPKMCPDSEPVEFSPDSYF
jgi:CRISPR/Cas system-associated endonuclease/helicase Cas3